MLPDVSKNHVYDVVGHMIYFDAITFTEKDIKSIS